MGNASGDRTVQVARLIEHPCAAIPEFAAYREQHHVVKEALVAETGGERPAFIERASQTIAQCVLRPSGGDAGSAPTLLTKLYRQGYSQDTITRALAAAWFDEADEFLLPRRRPNSIWQSGWFLWGLPLLLALLMLLELIDWLRRAYPAQAGLALWFAPVLGMLGFAIAVALHAVLKAVLNLPERLMRRAPEGGRNPLLAATTKTVAPAERPAAMPIMTRVQTTLEHADSDRRGAQTQELAPSPARHDDAITRQITPIHIAYQPEYPMHLFADGINQVTLSNGVLRIQFVQSGPDNAVLEAGTLILPASQAATVVNHLTQTLQQLDEQLKAQQASTH